MTKPHDDDFGALVAGVDQLGALAPLIAQPVSAFYRALIAQGVSDAGATHLAGLHLQHLLTLSTTNEGD